MKNCERCGQLEEDYCGATVIYKDESFTKEVYLCADCANRLYHWFKMECSRYGCDEN